MRRREIRAIGTLFVVFGAICGSLTGQNANSDQNVASSGSAMTSPSQSETTPRNAQPDPTYVIGDDDQLSISVWKEPDISKEVPVRSDGKISLPLVGEVEAAGRTPPQLQQAITDKLRKFINDPQVTVIVLAIKSQKFNILGQVMKPGTYPLINGTTIVDAIAAAGGLRDFAKKKDIYLLRDTPGGSQTKLFFNYDKFIKGKDASQNILLKSHDTIFVP